MDTAENTIGKLINRFETQDPSDLCPEAMHKVASELEKTSCMIPSHAHHFIDRIHRVLSWYDPDLLTTQS